MDFWTFLADPAKQLPALALAGYFIWRIVQAQSKERESERADRRQMVDSFKDSMKAVGDSCHQFQQRMSEEKKETDATLAKVIDRNTKALDENTKGFARVETHLERLESPK